MIKYLHLFYLKFAHTICIFGYHFFNEVANDNRATDEWKQRFELRASWFKNRVDIYEFKIRGWFL